MIAKEITKIHEEFIRIDLDNFKTHKSPLKGELTFIISNMDLKEKTINEEKIINIAPNSIDMSGLITIIVPMKPIISALVLRILIFSPIKITARIVAKIGTVKPRVVNCARGVEVIP